MWENIKWSSILYWEQSVTFLTCAVYPAFRLEPGPGWGRITSQTWADEWAVYVVTFRRGSTSISIILTLINIYNSKKILAHIHYKVNCVLFSPFIHFYVVSKYLLEPFIPVQLVPSLVWNSCFPFDLNPDKQVQ